MADLATIIDAIAADFQTVGLGTYTERHYVSPVVISPELCPMLSITAGEAEPYLLSTQSDYENPDVVLISWFESFADVLTTGKFDPVRARAALVRAGLIRARLETYGIKVPGITEACEATLTKLRYGTTQAEGGVWAVQATLQVRTWTG